MTDQIPFDVTFQEAADFFADKIVMTREEFDALADWARGRAFTVATMTKAEMLQDALEAVQQAISDGTTIGVFQAAFDDIMAERGWIGSTPWHLNTVFSTNVQTGYGVGRWKQIQAVKKVFEFLRYITGERPREDHSSKDGIIQPVDSEFWIRYMPPWAYGCNCSEESLTQEEADAEGYDPDEKVDLSDEPDFSSPAAGASYSADLSGLDSAIASGAANDLFTGGDESAD